MNTNHHPSMAPRTIARLLCLTALLLAGCEGPTTAPTVSKPEGKPQTGLATTQMNLGGRMFSLEIADTEDRRQTGMMFRESAPVESGMIFIFPYPQPLAFWMKNTLINLDILYLDENGKIISIHTMYARDLTQVPSGGPAQYAIELNEGIVKQLKLAVGQQLELPATVKKDR